MRRSVPTPAGATIDPRRAVGNAPPADVVTPKEQSREQSPKRKARKAKAPARDRTPAAAPAPPAPRSAQKRERIPDDLACRRAFFAMRVGRYRMLTGAPAVGLYEDVSV